MGVASNRPCCGVCGLKLVKSGVTSAGRTRWRCRSCGASTTRQREDVTRRADLAAFLAWLLGSAPQGATPTLGRAFRRRTAWCWNVEVPRPPVTGEIHDVVVLDGTYFQHWGLLIATNGKDVIDWQWCDREKAIAWLQILQRHPAPALVVIDGGTGLKKAIDQAWPDTRVQRCYFHIYQALRRHLTLSPRLPAGKELLALTRALMRVEDLDQAAAWLGEYVAWEARWDGFLRHRSYASKHYERPAGVRPDRPWWYTHRRLRSARSLLRHLIRSRTLFTWLDPELPQRKPPWPRTTSSLEGGPNRALKELFSRHRGLPDEHARRAAEWKLNSLSIAPYNPWDLARPEHWNPAPPRPATTPEADPKPQLGTHFSPEDGNSIRHGWAGRHQP
ncbi:IS1249 family transposase [Brachybacterium sp. Marseille-Q7125]|uniref:IS1249 family transposase n=1 Tax=Brachybacterium sp. Marseille-Q7125 TaxID=2932815 RepID=UPI001FF44FCC|nr:IS1249 family transposase [Brachybacterium sp. Marseille-Q7125]